MENIEHYKSLLGKLLKVAMQNARKANDVACDADLYSSDHKSEAVLGYVSLAYSDFRSIWTIVNSVDGLEHPEFDNLMGKADEFCNEFLDSLKSDHSQHWTDIHYGELVRIAYSVGLLLDVDPVTDDEKKTL
ncbi:hypothetical protein [Loigolactobacillus rennini]|nr:hypothetical protein [Loigolactobacillus rennini]